MKRRPILLVRDLALLLGAALTLAPLVWMVSASLMPAGEANAFPPSFLPSRVTFEHYATLLSQLSLGRAFLNSLLVSALITAGSVLLNGMAGYGFAKLKFKGRGPILAILFAGLAIPVQVAMLPLFLLLRALHLVNTYAGLVVPTVAGIFGIFLVYQYARSIPDELLDAARLDGAGEGRLFLFVALPVLRPILATLAVFTFLGAWNDFLFPLIVLTGSEHYTLPVALASLAGEHVQDTELMMAGAVLTTMPVLLVFLALQKHYIAGITLGSVKE